MIFKKSRQITTKEFIILFKQLTLLIESGISMTQSCDILISQQSNHSIRKFILTLKNNLLSGKSINASFDQSFIKFDPFILHLLEIGEKSGKLNVMLHQIVLSLEKSLSIKNKFIQVAIYPSLVLLSAVSISFMMLMLVIPRFSELFETLHRPLPAITQHVIAFSHFIQMNIQLIFYFLMSIILLLYYFFHHKKLDALLLKMPLVSSIFTKIFIARFSYSLAVLTTAGVPIANSLLVIGSMSRQSVFINAIQKIHYHLSQGQSLHSAMRKNTLFPELFIQMIRVGEETGQLQQLLEKTAILYEEEIERCIQLIHTFLEPCILVFLGLLVGGLVIAMYLPLLTF